MCAYRSAVPRPNYGGCARSGPIVFVCLWGAASEDLPRTDPLSPILALNGWPVWSRLLNRRDKRELSCEMCCASMGFGEERAYGGHFATPVFGRRAVRRSRRRSHRSRVIRLPALVE